MEKTKILSIKAAAKKSMLIKQHVNLVDSCSNLHISSLLFAHLGKPGTYTHKGEKLTGRESYRVRVSIPDNPFMLPRKAQNYNTAPNQGRTKAIKSVEYVGVKECKCIMVDAPDHLYVTDDYILTHNTVITLELASRILQDLSHRILYVAHRRDLISQPEERIGQFWPQMARQFGVVMANRNQVSKRLIIASIQTLSNPKRINQILSHGAITHIIIDEAHRAGSQTYMAMIEACRSYNADLRVLGVTATPERSDGNLIDIFPDGESFTYGTRELIEMNYLVRPEIRGVFTNISVSDVGVEGSGVKRDYNKTKLSSVYETDNCFELVVESHNQYAAGRSGIAFTVSVDGAYRLAEAFNNAGVTAIAVDGKTSIEDRAEAIDGMKSGKYKILVNCMMYIEGFDLPMLEVCHLVRPMRQDGPWMQCVGRVLRLSPETGKKSALVLDYLPQERTLELSLHKRAEKVGQDGVKKSRKAEGEGGGINPFIEDIPIVGVGNGIETVLLDYFNDGKGSDKAWSATQLGWRIIGLGQGNDGIQRSLAVSPAADQMSLWGIWKKPGERWNQAAQIEAGDCDTVLATSEDLIKKHGSKALVGKLADWRNNKPSAGSEKFGRGLRVYQDGMMAGELSDAINEKLAMQALKRVGAL